MRKSNTSSPENIYLIGFMGAGKSTIGKRLARKMDWKFVDTDFYIQKLAGMNILDIFFEKGEKVFRRMESAVVRKVSVGKRQVIALGGGAFLSDRNRKRIRRSGISIYLKAKISTLEGRLKKVRKKRPLLRTGASVRALMRVRRMYYEKADLKIQTDGQAPSQSTSEIVKKLMRTGKVLSP